MDSKDEFLDIEWNAHSEQPHAIRHRRGKLKRLRGSLLDGVKCLGTFLLYSPAIIGYQLWLNKGHRPRSWANRPISRKDFAGVAVGLQSCDPERQAEEVKALGVKRILLRIPIWEIDQLDKYYGFIESLPDCEFVVCIMQTRREVVDLERWEKKLRQVVERCWPRVQEYQIGQGPNRSKWGFLNSDEVLAFASVAERLRKDFPDIQLVTPGIFDFEPIALLRYVVHGYPIHWDAVGCSLYVDRRGSPENRQMLFFDLKQKLLNFAACIRFANKSKPRFWITEFNWPLKGQAPYAPTWEQDCVSEEDAATYLRHYYEEAWKSELVERVYWWQLVSKGYGLVDVEPDGQLRRRPAFRALKAFLESP